MIHFPVWHQERLLLYYVSCLCCYQVQEEYANQQHWLLGVLEAKPEQQQEESLGSDKRSSNKPVAMAAHSPFH